MKPLVLTTEPSFASRGWDWNGRCYIKRENGRRVASRPFLGAPRFTIAELAAEYWCAATEAFHVDTELAAEWALIVRRFAALPHYDEVG